MAAVPFDTLKLARRLESAGFPPKQAGDTAEALAEAMSGAELATKADIAALRAELRAEIAAVEAKLAAQIETVEIAVRHQPVDRFQAKRMQRLARRFEDIDLGGGKRVARRLPP